MSYKFKRILIYSIQGKSVPVVKSMIDWLETKSFEVFLHHDTAELMHIQSVQKMTDAEIKDIDLLIVVGGDGSMLSAANKIIHKDIPILGINTGKLGFLVDHSPGDFASIDAALKGDYLEEKRTLLSIAHGDEQTLAMNELIISRQEIGKIMSMTLYINDACVCQYLADGLIIATPTGSTAHAMSAGGAIIHPESKSFLLIPVCPNKLNSRPIVIPENEKISIEVSDSKHITPTMSSDGRDSEAINASLPINIAAFKKPIRLIHQKNYSFYETLKQKLHWEKTLDA